MSIARYDEVAAASSLTAKEFIGIFKPRIAVAIMFSALGGMAITPGILPSLNQILVFGVSLFLASGAAGAFNQWAEADLDASMPRTAGRPFASGRLQPDLTWLIGITCLLALSVAMVALATNSWAAIYTFLGAFTYAIVYTVWLKRKTWLNIVVGGLAGSFAVLAGAASVEPRLTMESVLLAVVLFLWTPPHFWSLAIAARKDYETNKVPMLPVVFGDQISAHVILVHTIVLSLIALLPAFYGMGLVYTVFAILGGALFTCTSVRLVLEPTRRRAIENFLASLLQLSLLLTGIVLDRFIGLVA